MGFGLCHRGGNCCRAEFGRAAILRCGQWDTVLARSLGVAQVREWHVRRTGAARLTRVVGIVVHVGELEFEGELLLRGAVRAEGNRGRQRRCAGRGIERLESSTSAGGRRCRRRRFRLVVERGLGELGLSQCDSVARRGSGCQHTVRFVFAGSRQAEFFGVGADDAHERRKRAVLVCGAWPLGAHSDTAFAVRGERCGLLLLRVQQRLHFSSSSNSSRSGSVCCCCCCCCCCSRVLDLLLVNRNRWSRRSRFRGGG
mmetsp:Transcript_20353/g.65016  ORF Transcript_20353/g.65016 Transcript_20353/m.65016 type:complete len:256 (+) Transcript_20353:635-1402(+)